MGIGRACKSIGKQIATQIEYTQSGEHRNHEMAKRTVRLSAVQSECLEQGLLASEISTQICLLHGDTRQPLLDP